MVGVLFYVIFFVNVVLLFFHFAERFLFRAARDVSGVRSTPPWARVEIKLKMCFQALSHSPSHERASALTSPPPDFLFSSIPPSHESTNPTNPHIPNPHFEKSRISYFPCPLPVLVFVLVFVFVHFSYLCWKFFKTENKYIQI